MQINLINRFQNAFQAFRKTSTKEANALDETTNKVALSRLSTPVFVQLNSKSATYTRKADTSLLQRFKNALRAFKNNGNEATAVNETTNRIAARSIHNSRISS